MGGYLSFGPTGWYTFIVEQPGV